MSQTDFHKYTNTPEFKELLSSYESARNSGDSAYFDVDDLIDIAEYYHIHGRIEQSEDVAMFCLELYPDNPMALLFLARICLIDLQDVARAREYFDKVKCEGNIDRLEYLYVKAELTMVEEGTAINVDAFLEEEYKSRQEQGVRDRDDDVRRIQKLMMQKCASRLTLLCSIVTMDCMCWLSVGSKNRRNRKTCSLNTGRHGGGYICL